MKKLTIEEKAQRYDEAIKKIKYVMEHGVQPVLNKEDLQGIFPELKESEDEHIRKEIISALKYANHKGVYDKHIAWLEEQCRKETTWNKEDEENVNNILYVFNQLKGTSSYKEDNTAEKTIKWVKSLKDRLYSSNEYDKNMLGAIKYCINNNRQLEKEHIAWLEKQEKGGE